MSHGFLWLVQVSQLQVTAIPPPGAELETFSPCTFKTAKKPPHSQSLWPPWLSLPESLFCATSSPWMSLGEEERTSLLNLHWFSLSVSTRQESLGLSQGALPSCRPLDPTAISCTLENCGPRKRDLQSHRCGDSVLFLRATVLFVLFLAAMSTGR